VDVSAPTQKDIYRFVFSIFKAEKLPAECAILCLAYIERLIANTKITLHGTNWRRVTLGALILASKVRTALLLLHHHLLLLLLLLFPSSEAFTTNEHHLTSPFRDCSFLPGVGRPGRVECGLPLGLSQRERERPEQAREVFPGPAHLQRLSESIRVPPRL
jgi:hypothetical protein